MGNESQKEFWNGPAGDVWVEAQELMDRMLAPLRRRLWQLLCRSPEKELSM